MSIVLRNYEILPKKCFKFTKDDLATLMFLVTLIVLVTPIWLWASADPYYNENSLTLLFDQSFASGSWEILNKMDIVGWFVQIIISAFCFIGIAVQLIQVITTMLYLSNKQLFNQIHEIKSSNSGGSNRDFLGILGMTKGLFGSNNGGGFDQLVHVILGALPDIKRYSYYADDNNGKYKKDDNMSAFLMKVSLPTILSVFFFSMGFNGTLWRAWGTISDAMGEVALEFVNLSLDERVHDLLNSGDKYSFNFSNGTKEGAFKQEVSTTLRNKIVSSVSPDTNSGETGWSTVAHTQLGNSIESWVNSSVTGDALTEHLNKKDSNGSTNNAVAFEPAVDSNWGRLRLTVTCDTIDKANGAFGNLQIGKDITVPEGYVFKNTSAAGNANLYLHVFISIKGESVNSTLINVTK